MAQRELLERHEREPAAVFEPDRHRGHGGPVLGTPVCMVCGNLPGEDDGAAARGLHGRARAPGKVYAPVDAVLPLEAVALLIAEDEGVPWRAERPCCCASDAKDG